MKTNHLKAIRIPVLLAVVALQAVVVSTYAADADESPGQLSSSDYKFAREAAVGGMFEVNLGHIAAQNSQNPAVQQFGDQMVKDHGSAGQELQQIASNKGATLPTALPAKKQKEVDRLAQLSGAAFDKAYIACMVKAHKADAKLFTKASDDVKDPDLKGFAARTLGMVQSHLKMAQDLEESVKHELSMNQ
jgi:putative membrane protein